MRKQMFMFLVTLALAGCKGGGSKGNAKPTSKSEAICTSAYVETPEIELDRNDSISGALPPGGAICAHLKGEAHQNTPEVALVLANLEGTKWVSGWIDHTVDLWLRSAAASHRRGCIYILDGSIWKGLSENKQLQQIYILGHGLKGDVTTYRGNLVRTETIPVFQSSILRRAVFKSCQAGQKKSEWQRIFANSPKVVLDMSADDIPVKEALEKLNDDGFAIWKCEI